MIFGSHQANHVVICLDGEVVHNTSDGTADIVGPMIGSNTWLVEFLGSSVGAV